MWNKERKAYEKRRNEEGEIALGRHPYKDSGEKYEIERLQEWHKEVLRLAVLGYRPVQIAEMTGYTKEHISTLFNSAVFQEQLIILQAARDDDSISVGKRIAALAPIALERVKEVLQDPIHRVETNEKTGQVEIKIDDRIDPALKVRTAQDLLDRAGHKAIDRKISVHMTKEDIDEIKQDAIQAGIESGTIIVEDAEVIEERESA